MQGVLQGFGIHIAHHLYKHYWFVFYIEQSADKKHPVMHKFVEDKYYQQPNNRAVFGGYGIDDFFYFVVDRNVEYASNNCYYNEGEEVDFISPEK